MFNLFTSDCRFCGREISSIYKHLCNVRNDTYICPICQRAILENDIITIFTRDGNTYRYECKRRFPLPLELRCNKTTTDIMSIWKPIIEVNDTYNKVKIMLMREVWSCPTIILAKKYKVTDKAIQKQCKQFDIPKPPVGFWNKYNAGYITECIELIPDTVKNTCGNDFINEIYPVGSR